MNVAHPRFFIHMKVVLYSTKEYGLRSKHRLQSFPENGKLYGLISLCEDEWKLYECA